MLVLLRLDITLRCIEFASFCVYLRRFVCICILSYVFVSLCYLIVLYICALYRTSMHFISKVIITIFFSLLFVGEPSHSTTLHLPQRLRHWRLHQRTHRQDCRCYWSVPRITLCLLRSFFFVILFSSFFSVFCLHSHFHHSSLANSSGEHEPLESNERKGVHQEGCYATDHPSLPTYTNSCFLILLYTFRIVALFWKHPFYYYCNILISLILIFFPSILFPFYLLFLLFFLSISPPLSFLFHIPFSSILLPSSSTSTTDTLLVLWW